jgi:hypothetical protein
MSAPITKLVAMGNEYDYDEKVYLENPQLIAAEWRDAANLDILLTNGADKNIKERSEAYYEPTSVKMENYGLWDKVFWGHDGYWRENNSYYIKKLLETVEVLKKHNVPFEVNDITRYCYMNDWDYRNIKECEEFNKMFGLDNELHIISMDNCQDCGARGVEVERVEACADFDCCYKKVCKGGCDFTCRKCEKKLMSCEGKQCINLDLNEDIIIHCKDCLESEQDYRKSPYGIPLWYGISLEEYERRYF